VSVALYPSTGNRARRSIFLSPFPRAVAAIAVALFGFACGEDGLPARATAPNNSPPPASSPLPTAPPGPPLAVLAVKTFSARAVPAADRVRVQYLLKLILSETGGKSGAYVTTPIIIWPNGNRDLGCPDEISRIEPGGTWDMDSLGYCAPEAYSSGPLETVSVSVAFTDYDGRPGTLLATVAVTR
jgi:hypothetical protein